MIRNPASAAPRNVNHDDGPPRKRTRRRRRPEKRMTAERERQAEENIRNTKRESRCKTTRNNYSSYYKPISDWYAIHAPHMLAEDGTLDAQKVRRACQTKEGLKEQLGHFQKMIDTREHYKNKLPNGDPAPASLGTCLAYRTAFGYYVWAKDVDEDDLGIPAGWHAGLKEYYSGLKHIAARNKQMGKGKLKEGKSKMSLRLFKQLGMFFYGDCKPIASFANCWSWNLMCRHFNLETLSAHHIGFSVDAITCEYGKDKVRPDGDSNKTTMLKHVYANPFNPAVSVVSGRGT